MSEHREITGPFWVCLSRASSSRGEDFWTLEITDQTSGIRVVSLRLTDEEYARIHATQMITIKTGSILQSESLGCVRETKSLRIDLHGLQRGNVAQVYGLAKMSLGDQPRGDHPDVPWLLDERGKWNSHCCGREKDGTAYYAVTIYRYVPKGETDAESSNEE